MTTFDTFKFIHDSATEKARALETCQEIHAMWDNIYGILSSFLFHEGEYHKSEIPELKNIVETVRIKLSAYECDK